ncbi:MAG: hypothetical protein QXN34_05585 [Archaeoglobaceae archaeon]
MVEELIAFFLGFFSIFSPCVLPILPVVFAATRLKPVDALVLFIGLLTSLLLLNMVSIIVLHLKFIAISLLFFLSFYLLDDRIEIFLSEKLSQLHRLSKMRLPPFVYGFLLTFLWLPCLVPFLGISVSTAAIAEKPISIAISFTAGFASATVFILKLGNVLKLDFRRIRRIFGVSVFISSVYLLLQNLKTF